MTITERNSAPPGLDHPIPVPDFLRALDAAARAVPRSHTKSALERVRLEIGDGFVALEGTDTTTRVRASACNYRYDPYLRGAWIIEPAPLRAFLKSCAGSALALDSSKPAALTFQTDEDERITLESLDPDEFPILELAPDAGHALSMDAAAFDRALARVLPAAPGSGGWRYGESVIQLDPSEPRVVSTDGHRLHLAPLDDARGWAESSYLLPTEGIKVLRKLLPSRWKRGAEPWEVDITVSSSAVQFDMEGTTVVMRTSSAGFPSYEDVLDTHKPTSSVEVDAAEMLSRLALVSASADAATPRVEIDASDAAGPVTVRAKSTGRCASAGLATATVASAGPAIGVNPNYLADAIKACGTERVGLAWETSAKPMSVRTPAGVIVALVMPILVEE